MYEAREIPHKLFKSNLKSSKKQRIKKDNFSKGVLSCERGGGGARMGKKNSKLKQETIEELIRDTYCEYKY